MNFIVDKQTIADLNLLGKFRLNSIYSLYNQVSTEGGERILQEMFLHPFTDEQLINERSRVFAYFGRHECNFSFQRETFQQMEEYIEASCQNSFLSTLANFGYQKFASAFLHDEQYEILGKGVLASIEMLNLFRDFLLQSNFNHADCPYAGEREQLFRIFEQRRLQWLIEERNNKQLGLLKLVRYSHLLKHELKSEIEFLLDGMYRLDVYLSVSKLAVSNNFEYAEALSKSENVLKINSLRHPMLSNGIANSIFFSKDQNMLFLTGANMAGKSTFMKSFGIAIYLAHMGFPVAAKDMRFSVLDGIYSSINVADSLNMGHSHFYAEVLRVKTVAKEVASGKNLVILFDELFKGTNVKDAYDGTFAVIKAFSKYRSCNFIVSTHIIEVGDALKNQGSHVKFAYLPTIMNGTKPQYTYLLKEGVTQDRQGMLIIENEGILRILAE